MAPQDNLIFINTLNDIRGKLSSGGKYNLIRACGLLRHLLLDKNCLIHIVNRNHQLKIEFHVSDYKDVIPIRPALHWRELWPITKETYRVNLDEFISIVPLTYKEYDYQVKELIKTISNKYGGVHTDHEVDDKEKALIELLGIMSEQGEHSGYRAVHSICVVTLEALKPLEKAVLEI